MSPTGQEIWDQHSDEDKAVMLSKPATVVMRMNQLSNKHELSKPATVVTRRDQPSNEREPSSHKVNVHDTTVYDSIVANTHLLDSEEATDDAEDDAVRTEIDESNDEGDQTLHAFLASRGNNPSPADVLNVLLTLSKRVPGKLPKDRQANAHVTYAMDICHMDKPGWLIDHGANGGMTEADVRIISSTHRTINVQGISEQANERSVQVSGGLQHIKMPDHYVYPTRIKDGLPYVEVRPYTDDEWETLPHIHWIRDSDWDPAIFNHEFHDNNDKWDDPVMDHRDLFDKVRNYHNRQCVDAGEVHNSRQIEDKISTSLVECEHVKAKIGKALRADGSPRVWTKFRPAHGQKGFLS